MATWREKFGELSAENGRQVEHWKAGENNHKRVCEAVDAISEFFRQYEAAGLPDRDTELPPN